MLPKFSYVRALSIEEAVKHLSSKGARVHAGGTDILGCLRDEVFPAEKLVSISRLKDLRGISETSDRGLRIGALTTVAEIADSPVIKERYPGLAEAALQVASPQLRNQGTMGGNICQKPRCWYYRGDFHCLRKGGDRCYALAGENQFHGIFGSANRCCIVHPSDLAPVLVAFEASARIVGPDGTKLVPMGQFFVLPEEDVEKETVLKTGDVVTEVILPPLAEGTRSSYRKVRARGSWDFALAGVALAIRFDGDQVTSARVVLSGAAPIPWRSKDTEEIITGKGLNDKTIAAAARAATGKAEPLDHNAYKIPLVQGLLEEQLSRSAQP